MEETSTATGFYRAGRHTASGLVEVFNEFNARNPRIVDNTCVGLRFLFQGLQGANLALCFSLEANMNLVLSPPLFGFVLGTRVALAFGLGLLVADRIPADRRRAIGRSLVAVGAVTTIPLAMTVFAHRRQPERY